MKKISILGATGSIGQSTADVIASAPGRFEVCTLTAHENKDKLEETAKRLGAKRTLLASHDGAAALDAAVQPGTDITVAAISGIAGLRPLMNAIRNSKVVAIANKEPLVAAGALVMAEAKKCGTTILPIDSEHNAVFQVFDANNRSGIARIILTASGGPFLNWSAEQMQSATPEQAVAHPNWSMGAKISVDSATMMNKALEVIEAHVLFDMPPEKIDVVIHPQSVVHSMVEYADGSILAQMGASDMRTPIAYALAWPVRMATPGQRLDLAALGRLEFRAPDFQQFPALKLAYECLKSGPMACLALNAANEVAVEAFLRKDIAFPAILEIIDFALEQLPAGALDSIEAIEAADHAVRRRAADYINNQLPKKRAS
ncbi:MAG: 1-deoxy-D-xylulose-5-phosphate reductoisomerase [Magnetococcus sp. WYHC-3]